MRIESFVGGAESLSPRFHLVNVMPTATLVFFLLALLTSGAPADAPSPARILNQASSLGVWQAALLLAAGAVAGLILHPLQFPLLQYLEGYWGPSRLAQWLVPHATRRHEQRDTTFSNWIEEADRQYPKIDERTAQRAAAAYEAIRWYPRGRLLPTSLGNALRAAEDRAGERYGLKTRVVITRLYPFLSQVVREQLDDHRNQMDVVARFCVVWLLATAASIVILLRHGPWLFVALGTYGLAWVSYRAAVAAAKGYGEMLGVAIDLHRFDMLAALRVPLPVTLDQEHGQNVKLMDVLDSYAYSSEVALQYRVEPPAQPSGADRIAGVVEDAYRRLTKQATPSPGSPP